MVFGRRGKTAVMFQDTVTAEFLAKLLGGLLDDAGIGNGVDDSLLPMVFGVLQGKCQTGEGFTSAGRHSQTKNSRRPERDLNTVIVNPIANLVDADFLDTESFMDETKSESWK